MTTARRSWRSRAAAALAAGLIVLASVEASAHRRDEYLQAARIAIDPGRVEIELDLTPGIAVAAALVGDVDADRNGSFSDDEGRTYGSRVLREIRASIDGVPLALTLDHSRVPAVEDMLKGEGTLRLQVRASLDHLAAGVHQLSFSNLHRPDIGVYLANALVPSSTRVAVLSQTRDETQRDIVIEYILRDGPAAGTRWWLLAIGSVVLAGLIIGRRAYPLGGQDRDVPNA
jgi:hypothetical protein